MPANIFAKHLNVTLVTNKNDVLASLSCDTFAFNMKATFVALLISIAVDSIFGRLPPPINVNNVNQMNILPISGRKANVPDYFKDAHPLECGDKLSLKCDNSETIDALIETPRYPLKYWNNVQCKWRIMMPEQSIGYIYCDDFQLNYGDYFFVGRQRYFGKKPYAYFEQPGNTTTHNLKLKFKSDSKYRNTGFRCLVGCIPVDDYETTATTTTTTDIRRDLTAIPNIETTLADRDASTWVDRDLTTIPSVASTAADRVASTLADRDLIYLQRLISQLKMNGKLQLKHGK